MRLTRGSKAYTWGRYEAQRLLSTAWPLLLSVASSAVMQLATDASSVVSVPVRTLIGLVAKGFTQYVTDNSGKTL